MCIYAQMKAADGRDWGVSRSYTRKARQKRGGKIPLETSFWAWNVQRSKNVLHSGLGFPFILINEKKKEKNLGEKKKSKAREKLFGSGYEIEPPLEGEGNGNLVLKREAYTQPS